MEACIPKRAFTSLIKKPSEEIYEICITLKDIHGAVSKTAKILSEAHVNLRTSILFDAVERNDVGYWTSFIDLSKAVANVRVIEEKLRRLDVVQDVKIVKPEPLVYDIIHFPIIHGDLPAIVMPVELFSSLFDEIEKILSSSGFAAVFYNAGKRSGAHIAELLKEYGLEGNPLILALIEATKAIGWGQIEDLSVDEKELSGKVKIRMCFEALLRGQRKEKACHWTRGFIAGFLGEVVGKPVDAVETKCIAAGDETCEFEIRPRI